MTASWATNFIGQRRYAHTERLSPPLSGYQELRHASLTMEEPDSGRTAFPLINEIPRVEFPPRFRMKRMHRLQHHPVLSFTGT